MEIMREACLSDNTKVVAGSVHFFLGGDKEREELDDESSDEEAIDIARIRHQLTINKKSKKNLRSAESAAAQLKKTAKKNKRVHPLNFSAFHLLDNPQGFAEDLFTKHLQNTRSSLNLLQKLPVLQLVSRLIGLHELVILGFYSYFIKFLTPKQTSVTSFLAALAQATHKFVPPDVLEPLVQKIANEFVSEASSGEVASAGLNAIREICARQPLAIGDVLLQDLVMYRRSKDKGVMMAAKGLLSLYREVDVQMLRKRDRGREGAISLQMGERKRRRFGERESEGIEGLELLQKWKDDEAEHKSIERGSQEVESDNEDGWELDESESDDSGSWKNVEGDDEIDLGDSDNDVTKDEESLLDATTNGRMSSIATERILTPSDLAKLQELRFEAGMKKILSASRRKKLTQISVAQQDRHADDPLTKDDIEAVSSLSKRSTKAEQVALAKDGKAERSEHRGPKAVRQAKKDDEGKSSTNRQKARKKNFLMTLGKAKSKGRTGLVDRGKVLKGQSGKRKQGGKSGKGGKR